MSTAAIIQAVKLAKLQGKAVSMVNYSFSPKILLPFDTPFTALRNVHTIAASKQRQDKKDIHKNNISRLPFSYAFVRRNIGSFIGAIAEVVEIVKIDRTVADSMHDGYLLDQFCTETDEKPFDLSEFVRPARFTEA